jgi:hypothetical protein
MAEDPSSNVVDAAKEFTMKAYFLTEIFGGGAPLLPDPGFSVEFHIYDLAGNLISTIAGTNRTNGDIPDGAVAPGGVSRNWSSWEGVVPASTLTVGDSYRVTSEGSDGATWFAFHDYTRIYASAP